VFFEFFMKQIIKVFICLFLFSSTLSAVEIVDKTYRETFLDDSLKEDYYRLQMRVASFFDRQTSSVNGLVESYRGTSKYSYDIFSKSFIVGSGGVLDAQSFTYDCAVASFAYLMAGQYKKTEKIIRIYQREFYAAKGDFIGLCNAYKTDTPKRRWGLVHGMDGNRTHLGPNMWVTMVILQYIALTGKTDFLPLAIDMLKWAQEIKHHKFKDGSTGAASMGYGWQPPDWSKVFSTENVVDHYACLNMIKDIYYNSKKDVKPYFQKAKYSMEDVDKEIENIERWLTKLIYNKTKKSFNMGYNQNGVDTTDALDTVSWSILSVTPKRLKELNIDPVSLMDFAEKNYYVEDKMGDTDVDVIGYDFTSQNSRKKDYRMIWYEGTCFHITAMQMMSDYAKNIGNEKLSQQYKQKAIDTLKSVTLASKTIGMLDNSLPYTSKKPNEKQIYTTFAHEWEIPRGKDGNWVASSSSTGWYLITASAFNPFQFDKDRVNYKLFIKK